GKITATDTNEPQFDILIKVANIPLDATLAAALLPPQRSLYNQLKPNGLGYGEIKVYSQPQTESPVTFIANLDFKNASLNTEKPPFVISDITAKAAFTPDLIDIENLVGQYSNGLFSITGQIWPAVEAQQHRYRLSLRAEETKLNDNLIGMLPAPMKGILSKLQPKGKINFIADLEKNENQSHPDYKVVVDCLGNSIGARLEEGLKQPDVKFRWFSYPLKDVTGSLTITKDNVTLTDITATAVDNIRITPKAATIKINGEVALADDAFSSALITIGANDVLLDERLCTALPQDMQSFYAKLSPAGRFDLDFENIRVFKANGKKCIDLAGAVKFKDCNFNISPSITDADAALRKKGLYKTGDWLCNAQAAIIADRLKIKGISLTGLKADVNYDRQQKNWSTENLVAGCYGGKLAAKLQFKQPADKASEYLLQIAFDNIDLRQFLADTKGKPASGGSHTTGRVTGALSIIHQTGKVAGHNYQRIGRCSLKITDMQVGKVSLLAKLLAVLKLTEPKDYAFDRMLVDSYIKGDRVYLEHLDLVGDALTFSGSGWLNWHSKNVKLTLFARGSRLATAEPSILASLTEGIGLAVIRMDVTGNLYDPQVTTTTLPVIKGPLGILGTK
ncbi:MAG: hypothetical protein ACYSTG_09700, partial [Planctomycetota bacterium]